MIEETKILTDEHTKKLLDGIAFSIENVIRDTLSDNSSTDEIKEKIENLLNRKFKEIENLTKEINTIHKNISDIKNNINKELESVILALNKDGSNWLKKRKG